MWRRKARQPVNVLGKGKLAFRAGRPRALLQICVYLLIVHEPWRLHRARLLLRRVRWRRHRRGRRAEGPAVDGVARLRAAQARLQVRRLVRRLLLLRAQRTRLPVVGGLTSGAAQHTLQEKMKPA